MLLDADAPDVLCQTCEAATAVVTTTDPHGIQYECAECVTERAYWRGLDAEQYDAP